MGGSLGSEASIGTSSSGSERGIYQGRSRAHGEVELGKKRLPPPLQVDTANVENVRPAPLVGTRFLWCRETNVSCDKVWERGYM